MSSLKIHFRTIGNNPCANTLWNGENQTAGSLRFPSWLLVSCGATPIGPPDRPSSHIPQLLFGRGEVGSSSGVPVYEAGRGTGAFRHTLPPHIQHLGSTMVLVSNGKRIDLVRVARSM
jgi:hypothetical protein